MPFDLRTMRTDRLTLSTDGYAPKGKYGYTPTDSFPFFLSYQRASVINSLKAHGYNAIIIGPIVESGSHLGPHYHFGDLLDQPAAFRAICEELKAAGIWPVVQMGLEDAPRAQAKYGLGGFTRACVELMRICQLDAGAFLIGPESTEWIGRMIGAPTDSAAAFDALDHLGRELWEQTGIKVGVHLTKALWGPPGGQAQWLREATWLSALHYQYGFGHAASYIRLATIDMVRRVEACGVLFVGNEYSLDNEAESLRLGAEIAALNVPFANGGPGQPGGGQVEYNESPVGAFVGDVERSYGEAGRLMDFGAMIWAARFQFDAMTLGYVAAHAKQLKLLRETPMPDGLGLPPS